MDANSQVSLLSANSTGDLVTHSLTESVTVLLLLTFKERPLRPVTFETFDHSDEET